MQDPSFAVVIPARNAAAHLVGTLACVKAQTRQPDEIIVVDDGSTDDTAKIAKAAGASVIRHGNAGPSKARNTGVAHARSSWIAFLDADDSWSAGYVETVARAIAACPDATFVFANYAVTGAGDDCRDWHAADRDFRSVLRMDAAPGIQRCDSPSLHRAYLRSRRFIQTSALVVRKDVLLSLGGYDESLRIAEDFDLVLRLLVGATPVRIAAPLTVYYRHAANATQDPLTNFAWERHVWTRIIAAPDRYPLGTAEWLMAMQPAHLRAAGLAALRCGNFAEARKHFQEARSAGAFGASVGGVFARIVDTPVGHAAFEAARNLWRRRPGARTT